MLSELRKNEITIDVDFSCPGIEFKKNTNLLKLSKEYNQVLNKRNKFPDIDLASLRKTWNDLKVWKDKDRVMLDEIEIAYDIFYQEYLEYKEKSKTR